MDIASTVISITELVGIAAFAASGAMTAIDRELDLFGVLFLGAVTAVGGGAVRDILLGSLPPMMFRNYSYLITAVVTSLAVFLFAYFNKDRYFKKEALIDRIINVFDAIGLGVFSALGTQTAMNAGFSDNAFFCIFLGMTSGIGGGLLRDMMSRSMPMVLHKRIYAVASMIGAAMFLLLTKAGMNEIPVVLLSSFAVFAIRMLATHYRWRFPRIRREKDTDEK